jgi:hypothetical protein
MSLAAKRVILKLEALPISTNIALAVDGIEEDRIAYCMA